MNRCYYDWGKSYVLNARTTKDPKLRMILLKYAEFYLDQVFGEGHKSLILTKEEMQNEINLVENRLLEEEKFSEKALQKEIDFLNELKGTELSEWERRDIQKLKKEEEATCFTEVTEIFDTSSLKPSPADLPKTAEKENIGVSPSVGRISQKEKVFKNATRK